MAAIAVVASTSCATATKREPHPSPPPEKVAPASPGEHAQHGPRTEEQGTPVRQASLPVETPESVRDAVREAAVSETRFARATARALRAIAGMLALVAGDKAHARTEVDRMVGEIVAFEHLDAVDLDRADHVKAALERGVGAMRAIAKGRASWVQGWADGAAGAVAGIDPNLPLGLLRAPVQDALRALADAALAARPPDDAGSGVSLLGRPVPAG
jgi:hypothetical protein